MTSVSILNCGSGNFQSVFNAFSYLGVTIDVVTEPAQLREARRVVLPGVGAFGALMDRLTSAGFVDALHEYVFSQDRPYLGICVGMQILASSGTEFSLSPGLNVIPGECRRLEVCEHKLPLPHVGWNQVQPTTASDLFTDIEDPAFFYFVHSFHLEPSQTQHVLATSEYGATVTAAVRLGNAYGVQFHPEKSQGAGLKLLKNFAGLPC
jgi:glutamine amidotransferase